MVRISMTKYQKRNDAFIGFFSCDMNVTIGMTIVVVQRDHGGANIRVQKP